MKTRLVTCFFLFLSWHRFSDWRKLQKAWLFVKAHIGKSKHCLDIGDRKIVSTAVSLVFSVFKFQLVCPVFFSESILGQWIEDQPSKFDHWKNGNNQDWKKTLLYSTQIYLKKQVDFWEQLSWKTPYEVHLTTVWVAFQCTRWCSKKWKFWIFLSCDC